MRPRGKRPFLAAPQKRAMPEPPHLEPKDPLRCRLPGFVRRPLGCYRSVRLPASVHHRSWSLDLARRSKATAVLGEVGISRFPRETSAYVLGVSDCAGLWRTSRYRYTQWGLARPLRASASRRKTLTRLNTRPARSSCQRLDVIPTNGSA
jgi:hypothetical protein